MPKKVLFRIQWIFLTSLKSNLKSRIVKELSSREKIEIPQKEDEDRQGSQAQTPEKEGRPQKIIHFKLRRKDEITGKNKNSERNFEENITSRKTCDS